MDPVDNFPMTNRSLRSKEILGPRPAPLKVRKDPHKTRRPPPDPAAPQPQQQQDRPEPPPRAPVVIYTVSPKIFHTHPRDFMTLVQRLTGKSSSSSSSTSAFLGETTSFGAGNDDDNIPCGSISPAARYAAMEKANDSSSSPEGRNQQFIINQDDNESLGFVGGIEIGHQHQHRVIERPSNFPGILSPVPTSLPPISSSFFSPPAPEPSSFPFDGELSSILQANPSPPSPYNSFVDLFNHHF